MLIHVTELCPVVIVIFILLYMFYYLHIHYVILKVKIKNFNQLLKNMLYFCISVNQMLFITKTTTAVVAQSVMAFALQMEKWVFKFQPRQSVVKTGCDS